MADPYVTVDELKNTLGIVGDSLDTNILRALNAASRAIEKACSRRGLRRFWADDEPVERLYTAGDRELLEIHDAFEIVVVATDDDNDGTHEHEWDEADWIATPLNAATDDEPWTAIKLRLARGGRGFPTDVVGGVKVTARYGWPEIPAFVPQAVVLIASRLAKRSKEAPFAIVGFGTDTTSAVHIARNDPDVLGLINDYTRDSSTRSLRLG